MRLLKEARVSRCLKIRDEEMEDQRGFIAELWFTLITSRCGDMSQGLIAAAVVRWPAQAPHSFSSMHKVIQKKAMAFHKNQEKGQI